VRELTQVIHNLLVAIVKSGLAIRPHFVPFCTPDLSFRPTPIGLKCWECCGNRKVCDERKEYFHFHFGGVVEEIVSTSEYFDRFASFSRMR
jgi:hypothetical protein